MVQLFTKKPRRANTFLRPRNSGLTPSSPREEGPLRLDRRLVLVTLIFVMAGLLFTYSSSAFDSVGYFKRQLLFDAIGLVVALVLARTYDKLQRLKIFRPMNLMIVTWVLLVIVLFTRTQAHVHRWIDLGIFKLQPSEIAKVTLVIYMADYLGRMAGKIGKDWHLLIRPAVVGGITLGLIWAERDLGTPFLMACVLGAMLFAAGLRLKQVFIPGILGLLFLLHQLFFVSYRRGRILSFLDPFATEGTTGYQLSRSFLAVGSGGWFGKGLGNSELKLEYLPAAHTDFIFSVMCEELGLLWAGFILGGFCYILIRGVQLARVGKTYTHSLLVFGLTLTICLQAFLNMGMAIGLLPTKGIALPFFSYGGSSVIMTLAMMGIILNTAAVDRTPAQLPREGRLTSKIK